MVAMPFKMKEVMCYYLLLRAAAIGSTETDCFAADRRNLICSFPFNVNSTQRDFGVYFYPDDGGEEPVLDCAWVQPELNCIKQEGFEYKYPVSKFAEITIPKRFAERNGSYRCVPDGHRRNTIKSCRYPDERDQVIFTACDAKLTSDGYQVIINCTFYLPVESFVVKKNTTVVGSFTKPVCQNSTVCHYNSDGEDEVFILTLDVDGSSYDEYFCQADQLSQQVVTKGCSLSSYSPNKNAYALAVGLPLSACVIVAAGGGCVVYSRKRRIKDREMIKKEWTLINTIKKNFGTRARTRMCE